MAICEGYFGLWSAKHQVIGNSHCTPDNFFQLMKTLAMGRQDYDTYKIRIIESILRRISLEEILFNKEQLAMFDLKGTAEQANPLAALEMLIDGEKAIFAEVEDEAQLER